MGAIPASTLAFDVDKQKTDDYGKPPQQIPKSLSTDAAGTSTRAPGLYFSQAPYNEEEVVEQAQAIS